MTQSVDDLYDELSLPGNAVAVRSWAAVVFPEQTGRVFLPAAIHEFPFRCVEATGVQPPAALANYHAVASLPVTFLHLGSRGRPDALILSWANLRVGLMVAPDHAPQLGNTFYQRQPTPDIIVFSASS
jgi:hypothetical protein